MPLISNNVKIALFHCNILEQGATDRNSSVVVQRYEYSLGRRINAYGEACGDDAVPLMTVTVRVGTRDSLGIYYESLNESFPSSFTFVMNARWDDAGKLSDYDGALVADGYTVDVEESYSRDAASAQGLQMSLTFKLLLARMEFVGAGTNLVQRFSGWE